MTARVVLSLSAWLALSACGGSSAQQEAPALPSADPVAVSHMARAVQAARDPGGAKRAIKLLRQATETDPNLWEARYNLGVLLAETGDLADAEQQLEAAAKLAPNAEDVIVAFGEVRRRRGDPEGAVLVLEQFVKQHDKAVAARIALVSALRESGKISQAISHAREVLVRRPSDPNALSELALSHLERGEVDTAELLIQEALKSQSSAVAERAAGLIALKLGDDAVAFRHFARASELDPKDTTARLNMGTVLLQAGVYDRAAEQFSAVLAINPKETAASLGLAAATRARGTRDNKAPYQEAERLYKSILEREPKNISALLNLAILYADFVQRGSEAKPLLQKFLELAPAKHPSRELAKNKLAGLK
jgi:tetratricopeptide (TPR) repeat protein